MTHHTEADLMHEEQLFETWIRNKAKGVGWNAYDLSKTDDGHYMCDRVGYAWEAWQAARRTPAAPVPQGWQLVPVEPTRSMMASAVISAEGNAVYKSMEARWLEQEERKYGDFYSAMLTAAPQPPEADGRKTVSILSGKEALFAINIFGGPMREYAPGKWENAVWPSEAAPVPLEWTDPAPPCGTCWYDHVKAQSPLGELSIEWKSWKKYDPYCLYLNGEYVGSFLGLDDAKAAAQQQLAEMAAKLQPYATLEPK